MTVPALLIKILFCLLLFGVGFAIFFIWLWNKKSSDDRNSFNQMMDTDSVKTFYSPEEYMKERDKEES